jgi:hypothetical protein
LAGETTSESTSGTSLAVSEVTNLGIEAGSIAIGENGNVTGASVNVETIGSTSTSSSASSDATSYSRGIKISNIAIGDSGNISGTTQLGSSSSTRVSAVSTDGAATATDATNAIGLEGTNQIAIGADGNVEGYSFLFNKVVSVSVEQNALSTSDTNSTGIEAKNIEIGSEGNIFGFSKNGTTNNANTVLTAGVPIVSNSINGLASSTLRGSSQGIHVKNGIFTAGPENGDIIGWGLNGFEVTATSVVGNSTTGVGSDDGPMIFTNYGIMGTGAAHGLVGGVVGTNAISGRSLGSFNSTATTITGNATATGIVDSFACISLNGVGTINLSGNLINLSEILNCVAHLTNTVTATTGGDDPDAGGEAIATATSNAGGLNNWSVNNW